MRALALAAVAALLAAQGCVRYEFDHEFWLRVDGSGSVQVTGRPELWSAFKGLALGSGNEQQLRAGARALFDRSGLRVRRLTITHRGGRPYLSIAADFDDVNRLSGTPAFSDLSLRFHREGERLRLEGAWQRPPGQPPPSTSIDGFVAVRFHVPAKIYEHKNAAEGVERGNIVSWRSSVGEALGGRALDVGVVMDRRSILYSTVGLFAGAGVLAALILAGLVWLAVRRGRRARAPAA